MLLVKIGGGKQLNMDAICNDVSLLVTRREKVIIVHGASTKRDEIANKLGVPTKTITSPSGISSVYTDERAIEVFLMVYAGLINKKIVANLQKHGVNAVGVSGIDGRIWEGKRKDAVYAVEHGKTKLITDNLTGRVEKINTALIQLLTDNNYVPVICPPAISFDNQIINTDNDYAIAIMAGALQIEEIVVLFEASGLLQDTSSEDSVIHTVKKEELGDYMQYAKGRMKKKLIGAQKAFEVGIKKMYWADGRVANPIINALNGKGTVIS